MTDNFFGKELAARKIEAIPGMLEFDIPVHGDNRGWFKENFQKEKMLPLGFPEKFFAEGKLQNNVSFSRKNVLRGLHAEPWDKYISVADGGRVLGSWVDLREGESFGHVYQTVIDASKGIFVPRGVANGFQVLSDTVSYSYLVNDYWALELKPKYAFVNYADPTLGIEWEDLAHAEVSEADKNHPLLADVKPLPQIYSAKMKAKHLQSKRILEFWQVNKENEQPVWVKKVFASGGFSWLNDKTLRIVNTGGLIKINAAQDEFLVFNGKYLKIVSAQKFKQDYRLQ